MEAQRSKLRAKVSTCKYLCDGQCSVSLPCEAGQGQKNQCFKAHAVRVLPGQQTAALVCEGNWPSDTGTLVFIDLATSTVVPGRTLDVGMYPDGIGVLRTP